MSDYDRIEEPPPIRRSKAPPPARFSASRFLPGRRVSPAKRSEHQSDHASRPAPKLMVLAIAAAIVIGLQAWTLVRLARVRTDLAAAAASLEEARGSVAMLWATTNRLDQDQMARLAMLADSIGSVFAYAQGEIRLWETAYYAQERRLDENAAKIARNDEAITKAATAVRTVNTRVDGLARVDESQRSRLDALDRQDRTHGSLIDALARRTETQEATVRDVTTSLASLRETIDDFDTELVALEERLATSSSAYVQMDTRLDRLASWVEGFRRAGLSGDAVRDRLSALADELRRVRTRVDSLRSAGAAIRVTDGPP